jgi:hypothetical protein
MEVDTMFPNTNDWLVVKELDKERLRRFQNERQFRLLVRPRSREGWMGPNPFQWLSEQIGLVGLKLRPVEETRCTCPSSVACQSVAAASL